MESKIFLDLNKPIIYQFFSASWDKKLYFENIHKPIHNNISVKLFENEILNNLTMNEPIDILLFWIPILILFLLYSFYYINIIEILQNFMIGLFIWTLLEYLFH